MLEKHEYGADTNNYARPDFSVNERYARVKEQWAYNTGWTIANAGDDMCMFSSDFPHVEGGRNPIARFERSMDAAGIGAVARERFYVENFTDLLGPVLDRRGVAIVA